MKTSHKTSNPVLYSFRRCPYAIRARMAIYYSGICVELREVLLRDKPHEMLVSSKKGTVPVLVLNNNKVIDESMDIMRWALKKNDPDNWCQSVNEHQRIAANQLIEENDSSFKFNLDRYKYADLYPENTVETYQHNAEVFLSKLERCLIQHKFLISDKISIADIAVFPFIRQYYFVDKNYFEKTSYTYLKQWLHDILCSDLFASVMEKYPQWHAGKTVQLFSNKIPIK